MGVDMASLVVIDDDELIREVLALVAAEAGFECDSFESGDAALVGLASAEPPAAVVTDMQMPGLTGNALAAELKRVCGAKTVVLAMSGSPVAAEKTSGYDGFLLKPFSAEELAAACAGVRKAAKVEEDVPAATMLNEAVYENFLKGMGPVQVGGLYRMCLDDAAKRIGTMREALAAGDDAGYRKAAHAIKGGCGMVGATELWGLAAAMEKNGLDTAEGDTPLDQFVTAMERLGRMLEAKALGGSAGA
jgi:CheY-like chemotaxis protein